MGLRKASLVTCRGMRLIRRACELAALNKTESTPLCPLLSFFSISTQTSGRFKFDLKTSKEQASALVGVLPFYGSPPPHAHLCPTRMSGGEGI